jgi:hypothetical protein
MGLSFGVIVLHPMCLSHVIEKRYGENSASLVIPNQVDNAKNISFPSMENVHIRPEHGCVEGLLVLFLLKTTLLLYGRTTELKPFNFLLKDLSLLIIYIDACVCPFGI